MEMTRNEMMDIVIRKRGFESNVTIFFCNVCENRYEKFEDDEVLLLFNHIIENPSWDF